jgi:hypothetical protein
VGCVALPGVACVCFFHIAQQLPPPPLLYLHRICVPLGETVSSVFERNASGKSGEQRWMREIGIGETESPPEATRKASEGEGKVVVRTTEEHIRAL